MCAPAKSPAPGARVALGELCSHCSHGKGRMGSTRTGSNGYKNGLDFIITLVVVNSNSSSLTKIDTSYSISIELVCLSLVNSYNSSPPQSPDNYLTDYFSKIVSP